MNAAEGACTTLPFLCVELGLQSSQAGLPRSHPGKEASLPSALPAPDAAGSPGALLATEQRTSKAGGNSPRHGLGAAGDMRWGDAEIDRQIALPSPGPRPHLSHAWASREPLRPGGLVCPSTHGLWPSVSAKCSSQCPCNPWQPALWD